jgi:transcriptional regulator with PAS, ATPase and Fis domain
MQGARVEFAGVELDENSLKTELPIPINTQHESFAGIISQCPRMKKVFAILQKVATTDTTALILGETGTGKELVARALHSLSGRKGKLIPVNCGAIPEDILESELFGHEKGAFTGAISSRIGRFQLADGGTIFLDEIGDMSPKLQVKLLRVLQEKRIEPVGSTKSIAIDVRIVAATHKDLRVEVQEGRFREDLFYRLQVIPLNLPALRERKGDVHCLAEFFCKKYTQQFGFSDLKIEPEFYKVISEYNWPGNVRELENLMERLVVMAETDTIKVCDLPDYIRHNKGSSASSETMIMELPDTDVDFNLLVEQFENQLITMAMKRSKGNKKIAAKMLKLNRTTLVEKIKKKGLSGQVEIFVDSDEDPLFSA